MFGRFGGGLGAVLGSSWRDPGVSWVAFGAMLAALGGSWSGLRGVVGHMQATWYKMLA